MADSTLGSQDLGIYSDLTNRTQEGSIQDIYDRKKASGEAVDYTPDKSNLRSPDPLGTGQPQQTDPSVLDAEDYVPGITFVDGTYHSADELEKTQEGRHLIRLARASKAGRKRGFFDAVLDVHVTDFPFVGMIAQVGGSIMDAKKASDAIDILESGDQDLIKSKESQDKIFQLQTYLMDNEEKSNASFWGHVGDIVRAAPGFMGEFMASNMALGYARTAVARKLAKEGTKHLDALTVSAVNRGTKIMSREMADELVEKTATDLVGQGVSRSARAAKISAFDAAAKEEMVNKLSTSLRPFVEQTMGGVSTEGMSALGKLAAQGANVGVADDALVTAVTKNLAKKSLEASIAKKGSSTAIGEWARGFGQAWKSELARAAIDFGTWGTESSTMLFGSQNKWTSAVGEVLAASFVEAPIKGSLLYLPKRAAQEVMNQTIPGGIVTESELGLKINAWQNDRDDLREKMWYLSEGQNLMEYVSENSGRAFGAFFRAGGLMTGIAKQAPRAWVGEVGGLLRKDAEKEAGGMLSRLIKKATGSTDQYIARTEAERVAAYASYFKNNGVEVQDQILRTMSKTGAVPAGLVDPKALALVGNDVKAFTKKALDHAYGDPATKMSYRTFFAYTIADTMARNGWGPQQTLNALQEMGYHGVLGEMWEERYVDMASALLGIDDKQTHSLRENVERSLEAFWPERGWSQIMEEAVAFSVPLVTRSAVLNIQRVLGGGSEVDRARAAGRNYKDLQTGMAVTEMGFRQFHETMQTRMSELDKEVADLQSEYNIQREAAKSAGLPETSQEVQDAKNRYESAVVRKEAQSDFIKRTLQANGLETEADIAKAVAADGLMRFAVLPSDLERGTFADKMSTIYSSEQLAEKAAAQDAILADAAFLGRAFWKAQQYNLGDVDMNSWRKIAAKTIGIAGAIFCMEPALAQSNSIQWASVDEGADPSFVGGLGRLYGMMYKATKARLQSERSSYDIDDAEIDNAMKEEYESAAKDFARNNLLLHGTRLFANQEMVAKAIGHLAKKQGYDYDPNDGMFHTEGKDAVPYTKFYEDNKEEVEKLRDNIAVETLRLLTDSNTRLMARSGAYLSYMRMKPGDSNAPKVAMALAAELSGFGHVITEREIEAGAPISAILAQDAETIPSQMITRVRSLAVKPDGTRDYDAVPDALVEEIARSFRRDVNDPSDNGLKARKKEIVDLILNAEAILPKDTMTFVKHISVGDSRVGDDLVRNVVFIRNPKTGMWQTTDITRATTDGDMLPNDKGNVTWRGTEAEMIEFAKKNGLEGITDNDGNLISGFLPSVKLTPAKVLVTSDPILLLQKLGKAQAVLELGRDKTDVLGKYKYDRVDPELRIDDETKKPLHTKSEAAKIRAEEYAKAKFFEGHKNVADYNFNNEENTYENEMKWRALRDEYKRIYENVLGDRGYNTVIETVLRRMKVSTPSMSNAVNQALGMDNRRYRLPLPMWSGSENDPNVYVSVDYSMNIDPTVALVSAAIHHSITRHLRMVAPGTPLRSTLTTFWEDLDKIVLDAIYDAHTPEDVRENLRAFHDNVSSATEAPALGSLNVVISGLCLGMVDRAKALGRNASAYDQALSYIAPRVRELGSYVGMFGLADIMLGGTGFSRLAAYRTAGAEVPQEKNGILGLLTLINDEDATAKAARDTAAFKPAGMTWSEFETAVNQYAARNFKDRPESNTDKTELVDNHPLQKIRRILERNKFETEADVQQFMRQIMKVEPVSDFAAKMTKAVRDIGARSATLENQLATLTSEVERLREELRVKEADNTTAVQTITDLRDKLSKSEAERKAAEDLLRENAAVKTEAEKLATQATQDAGDTPANVPVNTKDVEQSPAEVPKKSRKRKVLKLDQQKDDVREGVDFVDNENELVPVHLSFQDDIDGNLVVDVVEDRSNVDEMTDKREARRMTVNIIRHTAQALLGHDIVNTETGRKEFYDLLDMLTDSVMPTETMDTLWADFVNGLCKLDAVNEDPTREEQDIEGEDDDGAGQTAESYNDGAKLAAAFDGPVLESLLSIFSYVSTETGREFQAIVNSMRDNIVNLRGRIESGELDNPRLAKVVDLMDALFNSRAVVAKGVDSAPDREAVFTDRLNNLLGGKSNPSFDEMLRIAGGNELTIDDIVTELLSSDVNGNPVCRKLAFFMSYLRSLDLGARRNLMTLACSSTACHKIGISLDAAEQHLILDTSTTRYGHVSQKAASSSFMKFTRRDSSKAEEAAKIVRTAASKNTTGDRLSARLREIASVLEPVLGRESTFVQVLTSPHLYDALIRDTVYGATKAINESASVDKVSGFVPLLDSVANILERYVEEVKELEKSGTISENRKRQLMDAIVTVEISAGLDTASARSAHKSATVNTPWSWVLNAYTAGLPETVARAKTMPERNSKAASKVAISIRDISSVMSMFMDKDISDRDGFAYHAYQVWKTNDQIDGYNEVNASRFEGKATEAEMKEYFLTKVLPSCRQRMIWPDAARTEILSKNICRDYKREELREACAFHFMKRVVRPAAFTEEERRAADKKGTPIDNVASNWYVPVYNGDHSSGVVMQIPTSVLGTTFGESIAASVQEGYKALSDRISADWLGFEAFGQDPKRSVLSCNEFPGRSMHGVRVNADGTVTKGHSYVHVGHNYASEMKGHNDAFLGMSLCHGYGINVQQQTAKDSDTSTHKLQVMGASGVDLTLMKSLITMMSEYSGSDAKAKEEGRRARGAFPKGSAEAILMDHLIKQCKAHGGAELNNEQFVDEDALKVGVMNSKNMFHPTGVMKDGKEVTQTLVKYVFSKLENANISGSVSGTKLDELLWDGVTDENGQPDNKFAWRDWTGDRRVTIADLIGSIQPDGTRSADGIEVSVVEGLSGKFLDLTYIDDTLMSYQVANVSHKSTPHLGKMARNNAVDGLTMAAGMARAGMIEDPDRAKDYMEAIATYGIMATVVATDQSNVDAAKDNDSCMRLRRYGAHKDGVEVTEQASRDALSLLKKSLNPSFYKVAAPLLSGGAVYDDATGTVVSHTVDPFIRNRQRGSRVFSWEDSKKYLTQRRLGSVRINLPLFTVNRDGKVTRTFGTRYGWFVNQELIDEVYTDIVGKEFVADGTGIDTRIAKIEKIMDAVRKSDRAHHDLWKKWSVGDATDDEYNKVRQDALGLRLRAFRLFRDHHGVQLAQAADQKAGEKLTYRLEYIQSVCLDDLYICRSDCGKGEVKFDRAAVEFDVPDPSGKNGATAMYLGGSVVGLPRTPSYNGSMWAQSGRASIPCTEIEGEDGTFRPGEDAMVMPDPQTLKILGCDHDGDKADCYMLQPVMATGVCEYADPVANLPTELKTKSDALAKHAYEWVKDGTARRRYVEALVDLGLAEPPGEETIAGKTVYHGYRLSELAKTVYSNSFVRGMFEMSRHLDCAVKEGDQEKDFYRTPMAKATRAHPFDITSIGENDPRWDELKKKSLDTFNFLAKSKIKVVETACKVSTSAGLADQARGQIVSLAGMLHLAQFSGCFNGEGSLFSWGGEAKDNFAKWVSFMYGVDGISNATFDDIKEQICLRLGWTPGMMDSLIVDLITTGKEPPTSAQEFFDILDKYVTDISNHGSRFWMMISSEASEMQDNLIDEKSARDIHADIREFFGAPRDGSISAKSIRKAIPLIEINGNLDVKIDEVKNPALRSFIKSMKAAVNSGSVRIVGIPEKSKRSPWHHAIVRLINDVKAKRGFNPASGLVYWAAQSISKGGNANDAAMRYLDWSNGIHMLQDAKTFTRSFNYTKADPASASAMANRERQAHAFMAKMKTTDTDVGDVLTHLFVANMVAYNLPSKCMTNQGRAGLSAIQRDTALHNWAKTLYRRPSASPLHDVIAKLFCEKTVPSFKTMQLEGNVQTHGYFAAALTSIPSVEVGDDLMSGNGGLQAWDTMEKIALAMQADSALGLPNTVAFHQGIVSMFKTIYLLFSTSRQSVQFPAFSYLEVLPDKRVSKPSNGMQYASSKDHERLACKYRDKDMNTQESMWAAFSDVMSGKADDAKRTTGHGFGTLAKSFNLTIENVQALINEIAYDKNKEQWEKPLRDTIRILTILGQGKGKEGADRTDVRITPKAFFTQFLPIYATSTERTSAPSPKTRSVLNVLPGVFERLSKRQAELDSGLLGDGNIPVGSRIMDMFDATDFSLPVLAKAGSLSHIALRGATDEKSQRGTKMKVDIIQMLASLSPDDYGDVTFTGNETVEQMLEKLRGPEGTIRMNPDGTHYVGFLDGVQAFRSLHELAVEKMGGTEDKEPDRDKPAPIDPTEVAGNTDDKVKAMAERFQSLVPWADVVYEGGGTFTIRSRGAIRGSGAAMFGKGAGTQVVIRVRVGQDGAVKADLNSPSFATSFCAAFNHALGENRDKSGDLTAEQFLSLTREEREFIVAKFTGGTGTLENGVLNYTLPLPSWSVDAKGLATLAGEIHLGNAESDRKLYHEYFHSMIGMFRTMGIFSEADVQDLCKRFGGPAKGVNELFNEEAAAEAFADWVSGHTTAEKDGKVVRIFKKLLSMIKEFLQAVFQSEYGFDYSEIGADDILFSMVLDGYAAQTRNRLSERGSTAVSEMAAEQAVTSMAFRDKLKRSVDRGIRFDRYETENAEEAAADRMVQVERYDDPMEGYELDENELPYHKALMLELDRRDPFGRELAPRKDAVRQLVTALANYRIGLEDIASFDEFADNLRLSIDLERIDAANDDVAKLMAIAEDQTNDPDMRAYARLIARRLGNQTETPAEKPQSINPEPYAPSAVPAARTDEELVAIASSATSSAEDRAKANLELKRRHPVTNDDPAPAPHISAALDEAKRIIATIPDDGIVGRVAQPSAIPMAQHTILRAAAHAAQRRLEDSDRDILSSDKFVSNIYDRAMADIAAREAATGHIAALKRAKAKNMKDMAESAAARLSRLTGTDYMIPSVLNVLMHMYEDGYVTDSAYRTNRSKNRAIAAGNGEVITHSKRFASSSDFAGALLAASGSRFGSIVETAIKRLNALAPLAAGSEANTKTLAHVVAELRTLSAKMNITEILENRRAWDAAIDDFSANVFEGLRRGDYDDSIKDFGPYVRNDKESETADMYQLSDPSDAGNDFRQMVLRMAADAVYTTAAQVKFCAEMGYQPGTIHEDMFTGRIADAGEFETVTRMFGIGQNQLTSDSPLLARWNTPTFIATNIDDWYAGAIREAFGQRNVREIFMEDSKKFRGDMAALMRQVNLVTMEWGLNRAEGRKLLAIQKYKATHTMDGHGFIKYTEDGQDVWGFSNDKGIAGAVTDISMTDNEMRTIQLQHQLATAYLNGDDGIVTGIDGLRFTPQSFMKATLDPSTGKVFRSADALFTEADLTPEAITKRFNDLSKKLDPKSPEAREMTSLEMALFRLTRQWHPEVTGVADIETGESATANSIGFYNKFVKAVLRIANETFQKYGDDLNRLRGSGYDPGTGFVRAYKPSVSVEEAFNDIILRGLEAEGLIRATTSDSRKSDINGLPILTEGVVFIKGSDIERMFDDSSAKKKLLDAGRDGNRISARHLAEEFGKTVVEFKKAARNLPWVTQGDTKYLNKLDTMLPVFEGTGVFMRNAIRMERDTKREQMVRISRHEATWANMLSDPSAQDKTYRDLTDMQLRMIHDYFNTDEEGLALMDALERGDYAAGKRKSQRTGLVVNNGNDQDLRGTMFTDVCSQIYRRQLERRISMLEGTRPADFETEDSIARMLQAYEHSTETGIATDKGMGLNASQLYRMYGVLPANFTIGHALVTTMRGIQNSLYFRSTLTSMLMTPDIEGNPLYFAKPSLHNWEAAGIPDAVWGEVARWWASKLGPSVKYDIEQSGIENARRIYDLVSDTRAKSNSKKDVDFRGTKRRYVDLSRDEMEKSESMEAFMCQVANEDDAEANALNRAFTGKNIFSLDGSEALGYARHLFQVSRLPPNAVCSALHRLTCWSKSMSVAFSYFFPIATKWESPTAAVGALATLGSNFSPDFIRQHGKDLSKIQGVFAKLAGSYDRTLGPKDSAANAKDAALRDGASEGWLDENFLGFQDIRRMMDTNDPFLADLVMWAESIGISMTDRLVNPMEPGKATVVEDIQTMSGIIKKTFGKQAAANFDAVMDAVFIRQGEKAFTYALNATKLAVAAQVALKLKHQAELEGKAFDPIRDMKGIAEYVDSEVGGVNAYRYAWAHPHMQRLLNLLWFSWQWTRTAWEAGGGGILEDIFFGGHTVSKQQKKATPGRWFRMYGEVILGVPFVIQLVGKAISWAVCPDDDDDDKWFTWQNDSKVGATSANITPYLRVMRSFDEVIGSPLRALKNNPYAVAGVSALLGAAQGYRKGGLSGAVLGAGVGFGAGGAASSVIPLYHNRNNMSVNQNEQYFANVGKQGLEFFRWFDNFVGQLMTKQSLGLQALETMMLGYNPSAPDIPVSRWKGFVSMFMPFSASGVHQYGPAGGIALGMSVKKGSSQRALINRTVSRMIQIAENDRSLYLLGTKNREGKRGAILAKRLADIKHDARMAGIVDFENDVVGPAGREVVGKYTEELFRSQPKNSMADFDVRATEAAMRKLKRLGSNYDDVVDAIKKKYKAKGHEFGIDPKNARFERRIERILDTLYHNAGGIEGMELENQFRENARRDY